MATGIPEGRLYEFWSHLWPMLRPAYEMSKKRDDILAGVMSKDLQLWAICEKNIPVAGIVTFIRVATSGHRDCRIWLVGGVRLNEWLPDFMSRVTPWARAEGCTSLSGAGRKGWTRAAARLGCIRVEDEDGQACWSLSL